MADSITDSFEKEFARLGAPAPDLHRGADRSVGCLFTPSFDEPSYIEATSDEASVLVALRFDSGRREYHCLLGTSDARALIVEVDEILSHTDPVERWISLDGCPVRAWVEAGPLRWSGEGHPYEGNRVGRAAFALYSLLERALEREPSVGARKEFENLWPYLRSSAPIRS